jgi:hypothetical protein
VRYQDLSGENHFTNFLHSIYWIRTAEGERMLGNYHSQFSEADLRSRAKTQFKLGFAELHREILLEEADSAGGPILSREAKLE